MRLRPVVFALLVPAFLFGCATGETVVPTLGQAPEPLPVPSPAPPPPADPATDSATDRYQLRRPGMTEILKERGIPDRVANENDHTIWIFEGPEGEEIFTFGKEGEFVSFEARERRPGT